jgi:hypothetical protein
VPHLRDSLTLERHRHRCQFNRDYEAVRTGEGVRITAPDSITEDARTSNT